MSYHLKSILLSLCSGILFWLAWPPHSLGWISFLAFIPLLQIQFYHKEHLIKPSVFYLLVYNSLLIWNILTTSWIWYASPGGCVAAIVLNTLMMSIVWWIFSYVSKKINSFLSFAFLISFWITYEFLHLNWDGTWPWLVIGNVFANNTSLIQWYEYTGHLGGTVWVLIVNIFGKALIL